MRSLEGITRIGCTPFKNPAPQPNYEQHSPGAFHNRILIDVVGPDGVVKEHVECDPGNVMNTYGLFRLASLVGVGTSSFNGQGTAGWLGAIQLGTSTTAAATNDAGLFASTGTQVSAPQSDATGTWAMTYLSSAAGSRTIQIAATFPSNNPAGAAQINEVGLYCYSSVTSNIAARSMLGTASVNKGASDQIQISYQLLCTTA